MESANFARPADRDPFLSDDNTIWPDCDPFRFDCGTSDFDCDGFNFDCGP